MTEREFIEAYKAYMARIYRYCLFRTNSRPESEDLTAEVFRRLLESRRQPEKHLVLPWLYLVARNLCVNHQKKQARQRILSTLLGHSGEPGAEDARSPWRDAGLLAAVRKLKPRDQQILFLRIFEDLAFSDVAATLDMSEAATKVAFSRSIRTLRASLEKNGMRDAPLTEIRPQGEDCGN